MAKPILTAARLREFLSYNPDTGIVTRTVRTGRRWAAGSPVGCKQPAGYLVTTVDGVLHYVHRLAWVLQTGDVPAEQIDHINGVRDDNRWSNLRDVTNYGNACNHRKPHAHGSTGYLGVCWASREQRFVATITVHGRHKFLGYFDSAHEAHSAYLAAKRQLHTTCAI